MLPKVRPPSAPLPEDPRSLLVGALEDAIATAPSAATAARWCGVGEATMRRWRRGETRVDMEAVLRSKRLSGVMLRCLADRVERRGVLN